MAIYQYTAEQFLPISIRKAWDFFSSPKNLSVITPPEMDFKILTALDDKEIYDGMLIDYTVKPLLGVPMHWQTKIINVKPLEVFADTQLKGPYKLWHHTHTFVEKDGGVLMKDIVRYELPFGVLGDWVHSLIVRKKIASIFAYRKQVLEKLFV
ncbi:MAG: SRPBCC family protein [Chitinophagales bacterium]|jgi:ligand-binding SRPBCC domain-containing protein|nr:SRPBCC family protein [Chitinophagales bacterium]